jgi:acyl dehydratase
MSQKPVPSRTSGKAKRCRRFRMQVTATTVVLGALASRDWRPMHHDKDFAVNRNGIRDIFINTPTNAAWFERYITDWSGPKGRLGRIKFKMKSSVFPGDEMTFSGACEDRQRRHRLWLGRPRTGRVGGRQVAPNARRASPCPSMPTTTPGRARANAGSPDSVTLAIPDIPQAFNERQAMDLKFTDEQNMLRDMTRNLCATTAVWTWCARWKNDPIGVPTELWKQMQETGLQAFWYRKNSAAWA